MHFSSIIYGLHDTEVQKIYMEGRNIIFEFPNGVYFLNEKGKEGQRSSICQMRVEICGDNIKNHIEINKLFRNKCNEISFDEFYTMLKTDEFCIDLDYYSYFANAILLMGYIGKYKIHFTISEIKELDFIFK